jgi:UDP-N-acetylglucosamine 1-carboxyvinyltransferase
MRASVLVLGPLLARHGQARVSLPGGCAIGARPIDLHIAGLQKLGADFDLVNGDVLLKAKKLVGTEIFLGGPFGSSVTATTNVMMAAVMAEGRTIIESAACEPEVVDLANFLNACGARITGHGTPVVAIEGVAGLKGTEHTVIADRIEAGTYMVAAAITNGDLELIGARLDHMRAVVEALRRVGLIIERGEKGISVSSSRRLEAVELTTQPYPGFPTDLQAQVLAVLCLADGNSVITEKIFPDRFMHVPELMRMGAHLRKEGPTVIIEGVKKLIGAPVMASDLRASAALVLAGLIAKGTTRVNRAYHIDRGYEQIEKKLAAVGANIRRVDDQ